jgi:hypothetical protein
MESCVVRWQQVSEHLTHQHHVPALHQLLGPTITTTAAAASPPTTVMNTSTTTATSTSLTTTTTTTMHHDHPRTSWAAHPSKPSSVSLCKNCAGDFVELFVTRKIFLPARRSASRAETAPGIAVLPVQSTPSQSKTHVSNLAHQTAASPSVSSSRRMGTSDPRDDASARLRCRTRWEVSCTAPGLCCVCGMACSDTPLLHSTLRTCSRRTMCFACSQMGDDAWLRACFLSACPDEPTVPRTDATLLRGRRMLACSG